MKKLSIMGKGKLKVMFKMEKILTRILKENYLSHYMRY